MSEQYHTEVEFLFGDGIRVEGSLVSGACIATYNVTREDLREPPGPDDVELVCIEDVRIDSLTSSMDEDEQDGWGYVDEGTPRHAALAKALRPLVEEHLRDNVGRWFPAETVEEDVESEDPEDA